MAHCVLDVATPKIGLRRPRVVAFVDRCITTCAGAPRTHGLAPKPARSIMRANPAVVKRDRCLEVNANGDLGSCFRYGIDEVASVNF
jgi:hypothetical protein